jgi:hypothetical protein
MKANTETQITINLSMSLSEALWLKAFVQNSPTADESPQDAELRKHFWDTLSAATQPSMLPR